MQAKLAGVNTAIYSRTTGKLITANYKPSDEAIRKVAEVALALAIVEQANLASALASKSYLEAVTITNTQTNF